MLHASLQLQGLLRPVPAGPGSGRLLAPGDRLGPPGLRHAVVPGREAGLTRPAGQGGGEGPEADPEADSESFARAFAAHEPDVVQVCRRLLGRRDEADDATQEVFLRARRAFARYDPERPFRPWLLAIAGNLCIDRLRQLAVEQRVFADLDPEDAADGGEARSPLTRLLRREERRAVSEAIGRLPLKYRLPLVLRYFGDLDYEAIAQTLGVSRNQVATLLFRAKQRLRRAVREPAAAPLRRPGRRP